MEGIKTIIYLNVSGSREYTVDITHVDREKLSFWSNLYIIFQFIKKENLNMFPYAITNFRVLNIVNMNKNI